MPLRFPGLDRLGLHPGGEALVQPDVVPPLHRDQIAEPLVGDLVRQDLGDVGAGCDRGFGVGEQQRLAIENRRGVLHRARREVGHSDDVELLEGIFLGVVAVVVLDDLFGGLERESGQPLLVRGRADADRNVVGRPFVALEVTDGEGDEIRGHLRRSREGDGVLARWAGLVGHHCAVRDRMIAGVDDCRQRERRLERRLVERREHAPRVGRLELGDRVAAVVGLTQIQPAQLIVQDALIGDLNPCRAGGNLDRDGERRLILGRIEGHRRGLRLAASDNLHVAKRDLGGVENDRLRRRLQRHVDRFATGKGRLRQIRLDGQIVVRRDDGIGQPLRVGGNGG